MLSQLFNRALVLVFLACELALFSACLHANEKLNISGFVGLGSSRISDNNFLGENKSRANILELGVSANYQISNNLNFSAQIGYRKFGDSFSDETPRVDFASLNYFSNALKLGEQTIRIGRVKLPAGFYNASRDVPSTRPSIVLPQSVYLEIFRNSQLSADGILFNTTHNLFDGTASIDLALGRPQIDDNFNLAMFGVGGQGEWSIDFSKTVHFQFENDSLVLSATYNAIDLDYQARANDRIIVVEDLVELPIDDGHLEIETLQLSARVYIGQLEWTSEYLDRKIAVFDFIENRGEVARPQEGYYTQLRYPLSHKLNIFSRWGRFYRVANDKKRQRPLIIQAPIWSETTTTISIGANYQFAKSWQISAEIHEINGSGWLPPLFLSTPTAIQSKDWTLSVVQIAYRF